MAELLARNPENVDAWCCWHALDNEQSTPYEGVVIQLLDHKPDLIRCLDDNGNTIMHYAVGFRQGREFFSEEFITKVWHLAPESVHVPNSQLLTPFHIALRCENSFAIALMQGKVALDKIVRAFVVCERECPRSLLDEHCGVFLSKTLPQDLIATVYEYIGFGMREQLRLKRKLDYVEPLAAYEGDEEGDEGDEEGDEGEAAEEDPAGWDSSEDYEFQGADQQRRPNVHRGDSWWQPSKWRKS